MSSSPCSERYAVVAAPVCPPNAAYLVSRYSCSPGDHDLSGSVGRWGEPARDPDGLLGEPPQEVRGATDLGPGVGERLAHLRRDRAGELVGPQHEQVEGSPHQLAARSARGRRPLRAGVHGGIQGQRCIDSAGIRHGRQNPLRGRILDVEPSAVSGIARPAADEEGVAPAFGNQDLRARDRRTFHQRVRHLASLRS